MSKSEFSYPELTERQSAVFTALLQQYITTANAVGSRTLSKKIDLNLSSATIRNVMSDLEDLGMLSQQHTSAGRIPTTLGYGYYVDGMMEHVAVSRDLQRKITNALKDVAIGGINDFLKRAGETLAHTSELVSVVMAPALAEGVLHSIDLHRIATGKLLIVLTIRSGFVRSILLEISSDLDDNEINVAKIFLNERLSGSTLGEIRSTINERLAGGDESKGPLISLVTNSADKIFKNDGEEKYHVDGTRNFLDHPEFYQSEQFRGIIEVLEDRDVILHMFDKGKHETINGVRIAIGEEIGKEALDECSVLTTKYKVGETVGALGIIGPKRMDYAHLVSLVDFAAAAINKRI